jgi:predicted HAD superfamily phosphohydrolase YqeG
VQVIKSSRIVFFDVDDTLVMWDWKSIDPEGNGLISINNPEANCSELVLPHNRHIQLLKQFKARGHTVVVWSQGGHAWAESVCKTLGITNLVDICMDKPNWYVDDLPAQAFMGSPVYLDPMNPLKDKRWNGEE